MSVAITTACWGDYWDQFGSRFCDSITKLVTPPLDVVVVGEVAEAPSWVATPQPVSAIRQWDWFNEAVSHAKSEWVMCLGVDDEILPDGLENLDLSGDVISITGLENGQPWGTSRAEWELILSIPGNPMRGGTIFRREVFLRYPWRRMRLCDWAQWLEFRYADIDVRFDATLRFIHHRHETANSIRVVLEAEREINHFKKRLRCGTLPRYNAGTQGE